MACNFSNMNTKKLKINIPEGYEIDKEKSTFEEIVFKKVEDPLDKLPKTWEEYYKHTKNSSSYYWNNCCETGVMTSVFTGFYNEFSTEERVKQYVALGRLLQLRDYWVGDWKINSDNIYVIYKNVIIVTMPNSGFPLTFPTKEMAEKFKECFGDLIKKAYPLV